MRSVLAVTAVGLALIVAGLTGDPRALVPGALVALGLAVGGGPCRELQPDGSCGIYVDRPRVCRVDLSRPREVSFASWRKANYDACNTMQREDGMDERWRVG